MQWKLEVVTIPVSWPRLRLDPGLIHTEGSHRSLSSEKPVPARSSYRNDRTMRAQGWVLRTRGALLVHDVEGN